MQWVFLVLALLSALVELHTGTIYLAAVAAAALVTTIAGFWLQDDWLIFVFVVLCAGLTGGVMLLQRRRGHAQRLADFDIGQSVSVQSPPAPNRRLTVRYRGTTWEAVLDDDAVLAPGDTAIIARKTDKLLHLVAPSNTDGP